MRTAFAVFADMQRVRAVDGRASGRADCSQDGPVDAGLCGELIIACVKHGHLVEAAQVGRSRPGLACVLAAALRLAPGAQDSRRP
jgi:hypothetical protein